ncbi:MAG TPA: aminotransferase [Treponema sp.]|nr:MAG: aminotransferase [Treponema sp. GWA1_62_8]OHE65709.1 MAG: aminotransferase [Treponema sp. GWC1_61_84]HCM25995.1 aminotransferase [Treponema sp.]
MQALILAAGMGKRLGKYTKNSTKCMVDVNGKTLIERSLEALQAAGIGRVIIVIGFRGDHLKEFLEGRFPKLEIVYIDNPIYDKTNNIYSLWLAREAFASDDTLLLESDLIFEPSIIRELLKAKSPNLAVVSRFESWMDGTVTVLDEEDDIVSVVDKAHFRWGDIEDYYKTVNIYKFSKEFVRDHYLPFLEAYMSSRGRNEYYEQVLKVLAFLENADLKGFRVKGRRWYEIDDPHDLSVAETIFADDGRKLDKMQERYGGYWRFPALLDFCYLVNPYFPPKRMVKEIKSSFTDLMSQYPSGAKVQSVLAAKVFGTAEEQIVVGNGAAELIATLFDFIEGPVGLPVPSFNEYAARAGKERLRSFKSSRGNFTYSVQDLLDFARENRLGALVLVNPDNPTGHFLNESDVRTLVEGTGAMGIHLIVDESFVDFAEEGFKFSLMSETYLREHSNLAVVKSISKSYGVPGFRLGVLATGNEEMATKLRKVLPVWNVNSFGEFFLQIVDKYKSDYREACVRIAAERKRFSDLLSKTGMVAVYPSQANYILCRLTGPETSRALAERLMSVHRIFIKDLAGKAGFHEGQFIRLAVRSTEDNDKLLRALGDIISPNRM